MFRKQYPGEERRRYIRLASVFPVQFRLIASEDGHFLSEELQGFTNNIGKGGICLVINELASELANLLRNHQAKLSLNIEIPLSRRLVSARAAVAWMSQAADTPGKYFVGLSYEEINPADNKRIMRYAWAKKLFLPVVLTIIIVLGLGLGVNTFISVKLIKGNKALLEQLVGIVQESSVAKQKVKEITRERETLQLKIQALELRLKAIEEEAGNKEKAASTEEIKNLTRQRSFLQNELIALQRNESQIAEELLHLDKKKVTLEKANLDKMYQWLLTHQDPRTGLVVSFGGDYPDVVFTGSQAMVVLAYLNFSDFKRAKKILDFFDKKAKKRGAGFYNAYSASTGQPEYTDTAYQYQHFSSDIWVGLAATGYVHRTGDQAYLGLAEEMADHLISLQDAQGRIQETLEDEPYFTKCNLDAYALFNIMHQLTGKDKYLRSRENVLSWLLKDARNRAKRAQDNSYIALDTYPWSIAALGPERLEELKINPDRIIEFAEDNYLKEIVSLQEAARMAISSKIMARFYYKKGLRAKAHAYDMKADEYLSQICLSYAATDENTSSIAYAIFAYCDYNPLELED